MSITDEFQRGGADLIQPTRRRFLGGAAALGFGGGLLAACGNDATDDAAESAEVAQSVFLTSGVDFSSAQSIADEYELWDASTHYFDRVRLHKVSKLIEGRYMIDDARTEECPDGENTLMHAGLFQMEMQSTACDSATSKSDLDGSMEGQLVVAYAGTDTNSRGGLTSRLRWAGFGSSLVGTMSGVENAGTHQFPIGDDSCDDRGHFEGWIRATILEGTNTGCPVLASIAYDIDRFGGESGTWQGVIEGVMFCDCE